MILTYKGLIMKHAEATYKLKGLETKLDYNITKAKGALCDVAQ